MYSETLHILPKTLKFFYYRNLTRLELVKSPTFHVQNLSLDLKSMALSLRCSLGEVNVRGIYSAYNENLFNLIPVMAEGHVVCECGPGAGRRRFLLHQPRHRVYARRGLSKVIVAFTTKERRIRLHNH
ncbi:hypothetical protein O3G_MSEX003399 [Manduca sexta]|uniref:Uncharacterized protein n=1 Tax=Manduca sexta TaxID=7130 RepID=A0A921YSL3_MANSE|nr:hypothetical protein O3G_MSEX003399 [Manduca sexta]